MENSISRRTFVKAAGAAAVTASVLPGAKPVAAGAFTGKIKKAILYGMIKEDLSVMDKFKLLKDLGFDGLESSMGDKVDPAEMVKASEATGLPIHDVVRGGVDGIDEAVDRAALYGAGSVLVVAGRVNETMPYAKNYEITQAKIRAAIPHAAEKKVRLLVENVWNNFLISPLEMARYVDEFESEWVGAYFDCGNVARYGWPEHWIPVLGKRIGRLHIKPYSRKKQFDEGTWKGFNVLLGEGDIDWKAVRRELAAIKYTGWATAEVPGGDRKKLADIAERMDRVLDL